MKIVIIGAGNVATHLSLELQKKGYTILQIYSRTETSANTLADKLNCSFTVDISNIDKNADIYIYSVKDSALEELISAVKVPEAIHLHTSGSTNIDIFKPYTPNYGVLYPLQTFSKNKPIDFDRIPFFIEGNNDKTEKKIEEIAHKLSNTVQRATSDQRMQIHMSAVFACNFTNFMYFVGAELVEKSGFTFDVLKPLIAETADKINTLSPFDAQTGPAIRFDGNIIEKHLHLLKNQPNLQDLYRKTSELIHIQHKNKH